MLLLWYNMYIVCDCNQKSVIFGLNPTWTVVNVTFCWAKHISEGECIFNAREISSKILATWLKILKNEKALLGFLVKSILRLSRTEIWAILFIFGSYRLQRICSLCLPFKNIDTWPINGPKPIKFGAYVQIWAYGFCLITQPFFVQSWWNFI